MPLIRKLRTFSSMGPEERRLFLEALVLPVMISLGFRILGVHRVQAALRQWSRRAKLPRPFTPSSDCIRRAKRAQHIVKRLTGLGGNCLVRALTLWTMLLRLGLSTDLRVGFRKRDGTFEGHAWLEHDGAPINEAVAEALTYEQYEHPISFDCLRLRL